MVDTHPDTMITIHHTFVCVTTTQTTTSVNSLDGEETQLLSLVEALELPVERIPASPSSAVQRSDGDDELIGLLEALELPVERQTLPTSFSGRRRVSLPILHSTQTTGPVLPRYGRGHPVVVDSLINFISTLNPNLPAPLSNTTLWPKWAPEDKQLLTLSNPLGIDVEKDDFREAGIEFLNELHLAGVTSKGL
ncbi:hypothetical protein FB45DRAFT_1029535 [Roridomyces roridus]|uniref:Uncharacterized protein n=1 Tax=Roridomyces roridus TaxID=1738132 RepID=A0AAD7BPT7_9AGAR|nr:hypothetical protein FB45DRAFT_1029535 [Roridomyces roridus]